jgi:hypothetical protein
MLEGLFLDLSKAPNVLRGMGLDHLTKNESSSHLYHKPISVGQ